MDSRREKYSCTSKGDNIYQFVHADDLANAIIFASNSNIKSGVYNCGSENFGSMKAAFYNLCQYF